MGEYLCVSVGENACIFVNYTDVNWLFETIILASTNEIANQLK